MAGSEPGVNALAAIRTSHLSKAFGAAVAVDNLNLEILKGEIYGLVGPDGAGKTTTMRMLAAILEPTSGDAWVAGHSLRGEEELIKGKIGYLSQRFGLYDDLTVMENIVFYADLYEVPRRERPSRIGRLLGFSNLAPFQHRLAGKLSGGMKQKLGLACALIHTPEILLLDEPTNGVDPVSRRDFWKILYGLLKEGVTIFISTSYLDEAERCSRIGLIYKGGILIEDEPKNVRRSFSLPMIEVRTDDARSARRAASELEGVKSVGLYGDKLHIALERKELAGMIIQKLTGEGFGLREHREIVPSLEDVFISMMEEKQGPGSGGTGHGRS